MAGYIIVFWQLDFIIAAGIPNVKSTLVGEPLTEACPPQENEGPGDILCFLCGEEEIEKAPEGYPPKPETLNPKP